MLQNIRLFMPPIPTIKERRLFAVSTVVAIEGFQKLPAAHLCIEVLVSLHQETGANGVIVSVDSSEYWSATTSSSTTSPLFDSTSKTPNQQCPMAHFTTLLPLGASFGDPPSIWVLALQSALIENILCRICPSLPLWCLCSHCAKVW